VNTTTGDFGLEPIEITETAAADATATQLMEGLADPSFWDTADLWTAPILASSISAALLATVGVYIVLARAAFVSAAVSQLAGLGVVGVMLFFGSLAEHVDSIARIGGLAFGALGTALFVLPGERRRTPNDTILAMSVIAASALTLVGAAYLTTEYKHVQNALYGDAVVAAFWEVWLVGGLAALVIGFERRLRYRLLLVIYDPDTATAQRLKVRRWLLGLGAVISVSIGLTTAGIGALTAFAFSVIPAATALRFSQRLPVVFNLSLILGVLAAAVGYYVAFVAGLPVGPTMVGMLLVPLALSAVIRRE
jgi:zinc transport system permease protein